MVKNLPADSCLETRVLAEPRETWVRSLGWEEPLETEIATYSSILAWRIP